MQAIRKIQKAQQRVGQRLNQLNQQVQERVKPVKKIWKKIKHLPDILLVIIFILILGFAGWYEYNGEKEVFNVLLPLKNPKNYDQISLRTLRNITESEIYYSHEENDEVNAVAFDPNSNTLASGGDMGKINIWNIRTNLWNVDKDQDVEKKTTESDQPLKLGDDQQPTNVMSVAFSPDGKILAASNLKGITQLWQAQELENGESTNTDSSSQPDSSNSSIKWKPWKNWENLPMPTTGGESNQTNAAMSLAFNPQVTDKPYNPLLAIGNEDGTIKLWDIKKTNNPKVLGLIDNKEKHRDRILSVAFSQDGQTLASGSADGTVKLWNVTDQGLQYKTTLPHSKDFIVTAIAFYSPKNNYSFPLRKEQLVSVSWDGKIKLWDISRPKETQLIKTIIGSQGMRSLAVGPDGKFLAIGSNDGTIQLWNPSNGKQIRTLKGHPYTVYSLAFSPYGYFLASGSMDETIKLWKVDSRLYLGWQPSTEMSLNF